MGVAQQTLHFLQSQQGLYFTRVCTEKKIYVKHFFILLTLGSTLQTVNRELEEGEHEAHPAVGTVRCVCICRDPLQPQGIITASEYCTVCSG